MARFCIRSDAEGNGGFCAACGRPVVAHAGPQLMDEEIAAPVCRDCGRRHAPALVALLDLARTAQRVSRTHRPTIVPPLHALLDLARAAEDYTHSIRERRRQAA